MPLATLATLGGCCGDCGVAEARVVFVIDAPLCSSILPVEFAIDHLLVGADTFVVGLALPHTMSSEFTTTAGAHTLGARVVGGYMWPARGVTLAPGEVFADTLPFYCS